MRKEKEAKMYSNYDPYQAANRREAMTAACRAQSEPQVIAAALPVRPNFLLSLLQLNPLLLILVVTLVLILLGL